MPPLARVMMDKTATGDMITGPGVANVLIDGMPAAVVGDAVNGPACVNGLIMDGSPMVIIGKRIAARVGSTVMGVNPATGAPVVTTIATGSPKFSIP